MFGFVFCFLFGFSFVMFPCNGALTSLPDGTILTFLSGSTRTLNWTFSDPISKVKFRQWAFTSSDGSRAKTLATILNDGDPVLSTTSSLLFAIEKPGALVLKNINITYNGTYQFNVVATGGGGLSNVIVFIAVTPSVSVDCSRVTTVNISDNFSCVCRGEDGNPPANVSWYKGNEIVATGIEKAKLQLSKVTKDDNGSYTCVAKSHEKAKNETEIDLIVVWKPNVTTNCSNLFVKEGANFTCQCECKGGNPSAECTWYKNGGKIGEIGLKMNILTLRNVSAQDRGKYTCVGQSHTARDEKSIEVTVILKPRNTKIKFSTMNSAVINETVNVTCTSDGFPKPSYTFFHNNSKLNSTGNRYVIYNVTWEDAGTYNCTANNTEGSHSDSDILIVTRGPNPITTIPTTNFPKASLTTHTRKRNQPTVSNTSKELTDPPLTTPTGDVTGICIKEYIVVVSLASGIIIGIVFSYIVSCSRRKFRRNNSQASNPEPPKSQVYSTYQELDLAKMNKEDNYQSLRGNAARNDGMNNDESNYAELNKTRDVENNYQSLT